MPTSTEQVTRLQYLYAEDKFDITKEIIKGLNDKYKAPAKTEEKAEAKK